MVPRINAIKKIVTRKKKHLAFIILLCATLILLNKSTRQLNQLNQSYQQRFHKFGDVHEYKNIGEFSFLRRYSNNLSYYIEPIYSTSIIEVDPPEICEGYGYETDVTEDIIVYFVASATDHYEERQAIRETWGKYLNPKPIFFLGLANNEFENERIFNESQTHEDIIQENFIDTYRNLSLKTGFMLKHFYRFCPEGKFLFKLDDDVFVNTNIIRNLIRTHDGESLIGNLIKSAIPIRNMYSKWFMPKWLYNDDVYPDYLSGAGYIIPESQIQTIYESSMNIPFIPFEDIFFTGHVAQEILKINVINDDRFIRSRSYAKNYCVHKYLAIEHSFLPWELKELWQNRTPKCGSIRSLLEWKMYDYFVYSKIKNRGGA